MKFIISLMAASGLLMNNAFAHSPHPEVSVGVNVAVSPGPDVNVAVTPGPQVNVGVGVTPRPTTGSQPATQCGQTVAIPPNATGQGPAAYGQNPLVVSAGTTVCWTNQDTVPHTATSDTNVWDSGVINPGQTYSFQFNTPGTYPYFCTIHGKTSMSGTIEVR